MLRVDPSNIISAPFPHLVETAVFEAKTYAALKESYPSVDAVNGWQRMSRDLMRGDDDFDSAVESGVWRDLYQYATSGAFLDQMLNLFGAGLTPENGFLADPDSLTLTDHIETRADIASGLRLDDHSVSGALEELFIRMDFGVGDLGYIRKPHLDWRHRLASVLLYFDDAEETGMAGGEFCVHDNSSVGSPVVSTIEPRNNMGVFKLDDNRSLHSVNEIKAITGTRKTVFLCISSRGRLWAES